MFNIRNEFPNNKDDVGKTLRRNQSKRHLQDIIWMAALFTITISKTEFFGLRIPVVSTLYKGIAESMADIEMLFPIFDGKYTKHFC